MRLYIRDFPAVTSLPAAGRRAEGYYLNKSGGACTIGSDCVALKERCGRTPRRCTGTHHASL